MLFILGKFVQAPTQPLFLSLLVLLSAFFLFHRKPKLARSMVFGAFLLLFLLSIPWASYIILDPLESHYPSIAAKECPTAGAIVVLGGSVARKIPPRLDPQEIGGTRLMMAARLYKLNKAPWVVVSGGVPYRGIDGAERTESTDMKELLLEMGVPATAILEEKRSRNTRENASYTKALLNEKSIHKILLVTSAAHMPRSAYWFTNAGLDVFPMPSEHHSNFNDLHPLVFLPNAGALFAATQALKEYLGWGLARLGY